jgi:hypothetical protein
LSHYGCGFCSMDYVALSFSNQQQLLEKCWTSLYIYTEKEPILPLFLSNISSLTEWKHFVFTENVATLNWYWYEA